MKPRLSRVFRELPSLGEAGSKSARLRDPNPSKAVELASGADLLPVASAAGRKARLSVNDLSAFALLRWTGTVGAFLIGVSALGSGALPVVENGFRFLPLGSMMMRIPVAASALTFIGIGLIVVPWLLMAPYVGMSLHWRKEVKLDPTRALLTESMVRRTYLAWVLPIIFTAPAFTQDIYSYLAQGAIVAQGLDPYAAGPVDILGADNILARSVPLIWSHSPAPYGPIAVGISAVISVLTHNIIVFGVMAHRLVAIISLAAAGWAITKIAMRLDIPPVLAWWFALLNPITILHLVGGIHNESIMLGLTMVGLEFGLRAAERIPTKGENLFGDARCWGYVVAAAACICAAGMVKVTGFVALGFIGVAYARALQQRRRVSLWQSLVFAAGVQLVLLVVVVALVTVLTGVGLGWITNQGGAATIRSWLSASTAIGVMFSGLGQALNLGDHSDAVVNITRLLGSLVGGVWMLRMLLASLRGTIHPVGGLGVSLLVMVVCFPVVQPWYLLWALFPLSTWVRNHTFRLAVVGYSLIISFVTLPRGLTLTPGTVSIIYVSATLCLIAILAGGWWLIRRKLHIVIR